MSSQSNIRELKNRPGAKKWVAYVELDRVNGKRNRKCVYAETYDAAVIALRKLEAKYDRGTSIAPHELTVAGLFDMWLEDKMSRRVDPVKPTTVNSYREWIARLNLRFGDTKIVDLTEDIVEDAFKHFTSVDKLSQGTQCMLFFVIRDALKYGIKKKKLVENVTDGLDRPQPNRDEMKFLSEKQAMEMLEEAAHSRFYAIIHLAVSTGLREGELLALQWSDIKGEKGKEAVHVGHTLNTYKDKLLSHPCRCCGVTDGRGTPKSKSAARMVPLTEDSQAVLLAHKERLLGEGLAASPWVFPSLAGAPLQPAYVRRAFTKALKRAEVKHIRFHDLRHTFGTIMLDRGFELLDVQRWLGHSDSEMTKRYAHYREQRRLDDVERLNGMFPAVGVAR